LSKSQTKSAVIYPDSRLHAGENTNRAAETRLYEAATAYAQASSPPWETNQNAEKNSRTIAGCRLEIESINSR
jgi:hypothetical protein